MCILCACKTLSYTHSIQHLALAKKEILKILNSATGFFRTEIASRVNLKKLPKFVFLYDASLDQGIKMDNILESLGEN